MPLTRWQSLEYMQKAGKADAMIGGSSQSQAGLSYGMGEKTRGKKRKANSPLGIDERLLDDDF